MRIGELARAVGISPSAIRYYETVGIMPRPIRKNGARYYEAEAVDQLRIWRFFRTSGIPIRGLATIAKHGSGTRARRAVWVDALKARMDDLDTYIKEAERTRGLLEQAVACECNGRRDACTVLQSAGG
jgi:MerR family redox-sensitive transcriptional activator SoxR